MVSLRPAPAIVTCIVGLACEGLTMKSRYKRRYIPKAKNTTYRPRFEQYAQEKQAWIAHHPKATGEEYVEAMREIAARCGI